MLMACQSLVNNIFLTISGGIFTYDIISLFSFHVCVFRCQEIGFNTYFEILIYSKQLIKVESRDIYIRAIAI